MKNVILLQVCLLTFSANAEMSGRDSACARCLAASQLLHDGRPTLKQVRKSYVTVRLGFNLIAFSSNQGMPGRHSAGAAMPERLSVIARMTARHRNRPKNAMLWVRQSKKRILVCLLSYSANARMSDRHPSRARTTDHYSARAKMTDPH